MVDVISDCAAKLGPAPRKISLLDSWGYLRNPRPDWVIGSPGEQLATHFNHLELTFREGKVVWGYLLQANSQLFENGVHDCPGELLYSIEDSPEEANPATLAPIAHEVTALKGTGTTDPELAPIGDYLTDEMIRVFGLDVPAVLSPGLKCKISTTFFVRKHLPKKRICSGFFPLLVREEAPHVAMVIPSRYWPKGFVKMWCQDD